MEYKLHFLPFHRAWSRPCVLFRLCWHIVVTFLNVLFYLVWFLSSCLNMIFCYLFPTRVFGISPFWFCHFLGKWMCVCVPTSAKAWCQFLYVPLCSLAFPEKDWLDPESDLGCLNR